MSLTRALDERHGPIRSWFEDRLPNLKPMREVWAAAGPPTTLCPVGVNAGFAGAAFDYRLRLFFGVTPAAGLVAAAGARGHPDWPAFAAALDAVVAHLRPVGRRLDEAEEAELDRYCWVLGIFESHARMRSTTRHATPIDELGSAPGLDALLSLATSDGLGDLASLASTLYDSTLASMLGRPAALNPHFREGAWLGGADGDLVIDRVLVDVKTTKEARLAKRETAYQLLGYLLLDVDDVFQITTVGFYLSRIPALITWPAEDLLHQVAGRPVALPDLRAEFVALCRSARAA